MIIRSTKIQLKYSNKAKIDLLNFLFNEMTTQVCLELINKLLYLDKIPVLLGKDYTDQLLYGGRINQLLAKECSSIARSLKSKIDRINPNGNLQKYQEEILNKFKQKTLKVEKIGQFNLDSRFITIENNHTSKSFNYWLSFQFPKIGKTKIPIKLTSHMRKLLERGYQLKTNTLRIKKNKEIELIFFKDESENQGTETIGIDVGRNNSFMTSRNETENVTHQILNSLKKQKHGSKNKQSRVRKLKQTIDYEIKNSIKWSNLKEIILENLTGMKLGKSWGNINHHWSYSYIQNRIRLMAEELNVSIRYISPEYTSQICSGCGFKHRKNRNGKVFRCLSCDMSMDADLNASINILNRGTNSVHEQKDNFI